jgi:hypothetical protein
VAGEHSGMICAYLKVAGSFLTEYIPGKANAASPLVRKTSQMQYVLDHFQATLQEGLRWLRLWTYKIAAPE